MKKTRRELGKTSFKTAINRLIENCWKCDNETGNETDAAPFWENLFLYSYEEGYMLSLISFDK